MKISQKGFISPALIGVVILIILGTGYYMYSQKNSQSVSEDNTKDTRSAENTSTSSQNQNQDNTHTRNNILGISISYPKDAEVVEADPLTVIIRPKNTAGNFTIAKWDRPTTCGEASGADVVFKVINGTRFEVYNFDRIMSTSGKSVSARQYCVKKGEITYKITGILPYSGKPLDIDKDEVLNQILSSLKIESVPSK